MINYSLADICDLVSGKKVTVRSSLCQRRHCQRCHFPIGIALTPLTQTRFGVLQQRERGEY